MPTVVSTNQIGPDETAVIVSQAGHVYNSQSYDNIVTCVRTPIPNGSGGRQLENAHTGAVVLRSASGNHIMFIGGVGMNAPYSGRGMSFFGGETITLPMKNMNTISVMSTVSGEFIECMGFLAGNPTNMDISGIFIDPDPNPPSLVDVNPTSGTSGLALNNDIYAVFSECIASGSVNVNNFVVRLSGSATAISGLVFVDSMDCSRVWFQPYSGLIQTSKVYRATLGQSITDTQGNGLTASGLWSWTTTNVPPPTDVTLPTFSGTIPMNFQTDVDRNVSPIIWMSESVRSGTVNTTTVQLRISGDGSAAGTIPSTVTLLADLRTIVIDPVDVLGEATIYDIHLTSGIRDIQGNNYSGIPPNQFRTLMDDPIVYNVAGDGNVASFHPGVDKWRIGMEIIPGNNPDYVGRVMTAFRAYLHRSNDPPPISGIASGIQLHIRKASDGSKIVFENGFDVHVNPRELSEDFQAYDFINQSNNYAFQAGDIVELEWISGTQFSGFVRTAITITSVNAGAVETIYGFTDGTYSGATYNVESGRDLAGIMWVRG